jgi:hypothetical protein
MKCVRWCVYCFWQIHTNNNKHNKFFLMIHLKSMGNWSWGSTQIELVGAPLFFMYFHSQPVLIHSSGLSLQFKFFYSFGNQGILVLTNYHELRPFKEIIISSNFFELVMFMQWDSLNLLLSFWCPLTFDHCHINL